MEMVSAYLDTLRPPPLRRSSKICSFAAVEGLFTHALSGARVTIDKIDTFPAEVYNRFVASEGCEFNDLRKEIIGNIHDAAPKANNDL